MSDTEFSFDDFVKYIKAVKDVCELQDSIYKAEKKYNDRSESEVSIYFPTLAVETVSLLSILTKDYDDLIDYWVFELHFGEKYSDGVLKDKNGKNLPLKTVEDLWNQIQVFKK